LGIYPAVCASKRSNDLAFITTPNVRSWHRLCENSNDQINDAMLRKMYV
jgi:hypothetical protein